MYGLIFTADDPRAPAFAGFASGVDGFFATTGFPARAGFFAAGFVGLAGVFAPGLADFFAIGRAEAARAGAVGFLADFFLLDALANELPSRQDPRSARLP